MRSAKARGAQAIASESVGGDCRALRYEAHEKMAGIIARGFRWVSNSSNVLWQTRYLVRNGGGRGIRIPGRSSLIAMSCCEAVRSSESQPFRTTTQCVATAGTPRPTLIFLGECCFIECERL